MCSCTKNKYLSSIRLPDFHSVTDWIQSHLKELTSMNTISESALVNGDIKTTLFWVRCVDALALAEAFRPYGINASTDAELNSLVDDSLTGKDVSGFYKYPEVFEANPALAGQPMIFNVKDIVGNIKITSDKFNSPTCNFQYAK